MSGIPLIVNGVTISDYTIGIGSNGNLVVIVHSTTGGPDTTYNLSSFIGGVYTGPVVVTPPPGKTIIGNAGNNLLSGAAGNDTITDTAGGNDTLLGGDGNDSITDNIGNNVINAGNGNDTIRAGGITGYNMIDAGSGDDVVYANGESTLILGGAGNDVIYGGSGKDAVDGGLGNDTIFGGNGENALTGGDGNDVIFGGKDLDIIIGGAGADLMHGGAGNDLYHVDNSADGVDETVNNGTDTVLSSVSYTLAANVENLTLTGTGTRNGVGNDLANYFVGNNGNNILTGKKGNDTYNLGRTSQHDTIVESDSTAGNTDTLRFAVDVASSQLWFKHVGNDLEIDIIGTTNSATIKNYYVSQSNHVEVFRAGDGKVVTDAHVENLVNAMAGLTPPAAGQTTLSASEAATLAPVFAANWK